MVHLRHLLLAGLLAAAPSSAFGEAPESVACEVHVWAASNNAELRPADPAQLTPESKSWIVSVLDGSQRMFEIDGGMIRSAFGLPAATRVLVHSEGMITRQRADDKKSPITRSASPCYYDWVLRPEGYHPPSPEGFTGVLADHNNGRMYYKSHFRQFSSDGRLVQQVVGSHSAPLPVLSPKDSKAGKEWVYDTAAGTRALIENASAKILQKFKFPTQKGSVS